ncbi:MAG: hypothetical protein V3R93_04430, partial [Candidatus Hydrothermarchaeaceae archaeon]
AKNAGADVVLVAVQRKLEEIEYLPALSFFLKETGQEDEEKVRGKFGSLGPELLEESKKTLEEEGINVKTVLKWGSPADEILEVA